MRLGVIRIRLEMLFVRLYRFLVLRLGCFVFTDGLVTERETKMRLRQLRIEFNRLLKDSDRLRVLIVAV